MPLDIQNHWAIGAPFELVYEIRMKLDLICDIVSDWEYLRIIIEFDEMHEICWSIVLGFCANE